MNKNNEKPLLTICKSCGSEKEFYKFSDLKRVCLECFGDGAMKNKITLQKVKR